MKTISERWKRKENAEIFCGRVGRSVKWLTYLNDILGPPWYPSNTGEEVDDVRTALLGANQVCHLSKTATGLHEDFEKDHSEKDRICLQNVINKHHCVQNFIFSKSRCYEGGGVQTTRIRKHNKHFNQWPRQVQRQCPSKIQGAVPQKLMGFLYSSPSGIM